MQLHETSRCTGTSTSTSTSIVAVSIAITITVTGTLSQIPIAAKPQGSLLCVDKAPYAESNPEGRPARPFKELGPRSPKPEQG